MHIARDAHFARGVILPAAAFAVPGKAQQVVLKGTDVSARHLSDLSLWPTLAYLTLEDCRIDESGLTALAGAPRLTSLSLPGTRLTDTGYAHLGQLKNLTGLALDRTGMTDAQMGYVGQLTNLEELTIGQNPITDAALDALAGLEHLRLLWVNETAVTDDGLLKLAVLPRLSGVNIMKCPAATDAGKDALFAAQHKIKRQAKAAAKGKAEKPQDPQELARATAAMAEFAAAMWEWEQSYWGKHRSPGAGFDLHGSCRAVFARYCTDKPRPGFRPDSLSCADPSNYDPKRSPIETDTAELDTARRAFVYAKGNYGRLRYTLLKQSDRWLVDACHRWSRGRWTTEGL